MRDPNRFSGLRICSESPGDVVISSVVCGMQKDFAGELNDLMDLVEAGDASDLVWKPDQWYGFLHKGPPVSEIIGTRLRDTHDVFFQHTERGESLGKNGILQDRIALLMKVNQGIAEVATWLDFRESRKALIDKQKFYVGEKMLHSFPFRGERLAVRGVDDDVYCTVVATRMRMYSRMELQRFGELNSTRKNKLIRMFELYNSIIPYG